MEALTPRASGNVVWPCIAVIGKVNEGRRVTGQELGGTAIEYVVPEYE